MCAHIHYAILAQGAFVIELSLIENKNHLNTHNASTQALIGSTFSWKFIHEKFTEVNHQKICTSTISHYVYSIIACTCVTCMLIITLALMLKGFWLWIYTVPAYMLSASQLSNWKQLHLTTRLTMTKRLHLNGILHNLINHHKLFCRHTCRHTHTQTYVHLLMSQRSRVFSSPNAIYLLQYVHILE